MIYVLFRKLLAAVLTLFCATLILFVLTRLSPGDPVKVLLNRSAEVAMSDTAAYQQKADELRSQWGLDQSVTDQYLRWVTGLLKLDLGNSMHTGRPVSTEIAERLPATALLAVAALLLQLVLGLVFGALSAISAGKWSDHVIRWICVAVASIPVFVIGLVFLLWFAVRLGVYEISSEASLSRLWLPAVTLGLIGAPQLIRVVRANMLAELGQLYVQSALARGLALRLIIRQVMRSTLLPVLTMASLSLAALVSGAVVVESIFAWPGIGKYALDSILLKDYPVIQGYAFVMVTAVILINLLTEVVYSILDPRIRRKGVATSESTA